jgi:hypothetical protein
MKPRRAEKFVSDWLAERKFNADGTVLRKIDEKTALTLPQTILETRAALGFRPKIWHIRKENRKKAEMEELKLRMSMPQGKQSFPWEN